MEVYTIGIGFRQESIKEIVGLGKKVIRSGKSHDTYNHGSYSSETHQK